MAPWSDRKMPGVLKAALVAAQVYAFYYAASSAYTIRLHAVNEYGRIIHEFDPWSRPRRCPGAQCSFLYIANAALPAGSDPIDSSCRSSPVCFELVWYLLRDQRARASFTPSPVACMPRQCLIIARL